MMYEVTAEELASKDDTFTLDDWIADILWLNQHGYMIVRKENLDG